MQLLKENRPGEARRGHAGLIILLLETESYGRLGSLTILILGEAAGPYSSLGVKALIKQDIIHQVIAKTGLPRNKAEAAVDTVFESLKKALASGDRIELRGFGVFNVRPRKTGIGRNPRTGAEVTITPGKAVRFKPGKELHLLDS
jgi:nucleoid DNA-binding protein